ncbi:hypothetical protein Pla123a_17880 [Posidoniimonas polymericola]|uniref:Chromosome partition protein Smc n=1 Tax=Posidoniimonas polymericola TaxID=2528002 RepID=A0A5C5YSQ9_9BACT|nr:hypothetical protein [Posidoniimonas polymericola]TWT77989.1 hypothetical protein Pla123a_17880 [Posidoniimonas polymericola]
MVVDGIRGSDVLNLIRQTHSAAGAEVQSARNHLDELERATRDGVKRRGETIVRLARHYLPDISNDSIGQSFAGVRDDLRQVLDDKNRREQLLRTQWDQAIDRRAQLEVQLDEATVELNGCVERREELEQQLADILATDQAFAAASDKAMAAEAELARNEQRVAESRQEASDKLPAYQRSRLFQYLLERGFGTSGYKPRGLTRRLDKWVARLVDFENSKRSYNFLRATPELMAAEVDRRRTEFDALMQAVEEIERHHSDEIGLTTALEQGVQAGARRDALLGNLEHEQQTRDEAERLLAELNSERSEFYNRAVTRMRRFLETVQQSTLDAHAAATPSPEDDQLAAELAALGGELDQTHREASELRHALTARQRQLADLADLARKFRASEFDSYRSVFASGFDARHHLEAFLRGQIGKQQLWHALRQSQRFLPQMVEQRWERPPTGLDNDFSYVLMRILAEAAGAMVDQAARRGGGGFNLPPAPRRRSGSQQPPSVRRRARGGFTNGRGF